MPPLSGLSSGGHRLRTGVRYLCNQLGCEFGPKQVLSSVADGVGTVSEETAEAVTFLLPESEAHRAKVPLLESPMPEKWAQRAKEAGEDCNLSNFPKMIRSGPPTPLY
eukprot:6183477-Pleurochrysis_carterae.AAC.1